LEGLALQKVTDFLEILADFPETEFSETKLREIGLSPRNVSHLVELEFLWQNGEGTRYRLTQYAYLFVQEVKLTREIGKLDSSIGDVEIAVRNLEIKIIEFDNSSSRLSTAMLVLVLIQILLYLQVEKISFEVTVVITLLMAGLLWVIVKTSPTVRDIRVFLGKIKPR
jgi:hypothetical protein